VRLLSINSTMLASIGWNPATETMVVVFNNGDIYQYNGVPADSYLKVITAEKSVGKAFNEYIKGRDFPFAKIERKDMEGL